MYNLHLSPEQLQIRDTVRDFVAREIKPLALKPERLEARARPLLVEALDKASQIGLRTLALSEEAGGAGADNLTCCIVTEELAVGDPDVATVLAQTSTLAHVLFDQLMTGEQRARFLPAFLADQRYHLALAEHEADRDAALGINYHRPQASDASFKTAAVRAGDAWVVNGGKDRVVGAPLAALFAVRARVGEHGVGTLLVPHDAPGLSVTETEATARWHHGARGALAFDNCRVPAENFLGAEDPFAADAGRRIPQDQAINLGIGRAA
jgi:alkylation response protein AidB-like acyl-CoA dehydrogenase